MTLTEIEQHKDEPYAWPGGYPKYFITADGDALSVEAVKDNWESVKSEFEGIDGDFLCDWNIIGVAINYEDKNLYCAHTGNKIECAYD